jgi:hypothetical protein
MRRIRGAGEERVNLCESELDTRLTFRAGEEHPFLGKEMSEPREFSDHTARLIDEEIVRILRAAADRAEDLLRTHRAKLESLATSLEREEVLDEPLAVGPLEARLASEGLARVPLACASGYRRAPRSVRPGFPVSRGYPTPSLSKDAGGADLRNPCFGPYPPA